jgi:lipoprotein signal peptidase
VTFPSRLLDRLARYLRLERRAERGGGRRSTDIQPNRGWKPAIAIALTVAFLDWSTKFLITRTIPLGHLVEVIEGRLAFWHVRNDAMILGLYGDLPLQSRQAIAVLSAVLGALLLFEVVSRGHRLPPHRRPWAWLFVGLASGGMLGNLGERALHWGVTDFLSFGAAGMWLPPGNIADLALFLCIPVSAVVIVFELAARAQRATRSAEEGATSHAAVVGPGGG